MQTKLTKEKKKKKKGRGNQLKRNVSSRIDSMVCEIDFKKQNKITIKMKIIGL